MKKSWSLYLMIALYFLAGINHFVNPAFYLKIIPPYLGNPALVNKAAGLAELVLAIMLMFERTRRLGALGTILMLIAFIPTHIYMLQLVHSGISNTPAWILWVRLLLIQPVLIWWAWLIQTTASKNRHLVKDA